MKFHFVLTIIYTRARFTVCENREGKNARRFCTLFICECMRALYSNLKSNLDVVIYFSGGKHGWNRNDLAATREEFELNIRTRHYGQQTWNPGETKKDRGNSPTRILLDVLEISKFLFLRECLAYQKYFSDFSQQTKKRLIVLLVFEETWSSVELRIGCPQKLEPPWVSQIIYLWTSYARCSRGTFASIAKQTRRTFFRTWILKNFLKRTRRHDSSLPLSFILPS